MFEKTKDMLNKLREEKEDNNIVGTLLDSLIHLLRQRLNSLKGKQLFEVESLCKELIRIKSVLRYLEVKNDMQDMCNMMVNQLGNIAYKAEDVIDSLYLAKLAAQIGCNIISRWEKKLTRSLLGMMAGQEEADYDYVDRMKEKVMEIHTNIENFIIQFQTTQLISESSSNRRVPIVEGGEVVGLHLGEGKILKQLISRSLFIKPQLQFIAIIGMGGSGKTTLALKVYNDMYVQNHFTFRAWVSVSRDYKVKELLQAITKRAMVFTNEIKQMNVEDLKMKICEYLRSTRYLIVVDDVWNTGLCDELNEIFVNNLNNSRIILTTRNKEVALYVNPSPPLHYLHCLSDEKSMELLCKKVFGEGSCPPVLEKDVKEFVRKCQGLPLAINLLANDLAENIRIRLGETLSNKGFSLNHHMDLCMNILALSYDDLPHHLKWCFLYFAVFPQYDEILVRPLIRLWIAEGFVHQKYGELMEDLAEEYLEELIYRNLIQVVKLRSDGGVQKCRIHGLLRDLCILKAKEEKFLQVLEKVNGNITLSFPIESRRLALNFYFVYYLKSIRSKSKLISLLYSGPNLYMLKYWNQFYERFSLLRVLCFKDASNHVIPNKIEELIHLRYLEFSGRTIPSSICKLWNLQTLDVNAKWVDSPQINVWTMQQVRHLDFHGRAVALPEPENHDDALTNLQTLSSISPASCTESILSNLPNLLKLGIYGDLYMHMGGKAFNSITVLSKLQKLKLERDQLYQSLSSLDWVEFPKNITKLTLSATQLSKNPMQKLGLLSKLQVLKLTNDAYVGDVLHCARGGFPHLKVLKLIDLGIKKWNITTGSMASLQSVVIRRCYHLEGLPSALQIMFTLRELQLESPNDSVLRDSKKVQISIQMNLNTTYRTNNDVLLPTEWWNTTGGESSSNTTGGESSST